jgi:hypothetical protein
MRSNFLSENLKGSDHLEYINVKREIILKLILELWNAMDWNCLRVGASGKLSQRLL